jgi:hypothetical protein
MISNAITERLTRTNSGAYEFAAEHSIKPMALRVTHPGFVSVQEFALRAP